MYWGYSSIPSTYSEAILIKDRLNDVSLRLYRLRMGEKVVYSEQTV